MSVIERVPTSQRVVLVEPDERRRAAHLRALVGTGCIVTAVQDAGQALEVFDRMSACSCVVLVDVSPDEERTIRLRLAALAHLAGARVVALHLNNAAAAAA